MATDRRTFNRSIKVKPSFSVIQFITAIDIISGLEARCSITSHGRRFSSICSAAELVDASHELLLLIIWVSLAVKIFRIINELSFSVK